ncbi:MAG: radical SAM/SPASM domain-containing protein [Bacillota bacterium]
MSQNEIKHTQEHYGIRPEAMAFPMMCVLSFVYVCNAKCPNCPYTLSRIREDYKDSLYMSEETFKIIADQCGKYGAFIRISGGGEPMLHPKAVELIEYAKKVGAKVGLITNGSKFVEKNSRRLIDANIDVIEFSVDAGDKKTYSKVRPGLCWDTLIKNVEIVLDLRNKFNSKTKIIASVINQEGVDVDAAEEFWKTKVDVVQKRKFLTWGIGDPLKSADPSPYLKPDELIPCPFIFERLNIDSRGKVMVCGFDIAARTDMGNVHEKSIEEIWHGEEFNYYRQKHLEKRGADIEMCRDCPDWKYRSWKHNYWKLIANAEESRKSKILGS